MSDYTYYSHTPDFSDEYPSSGSEVIRGRWSPISINRRSSPRKASPQRKSPTKCSGGRVRNPRTNRCVDPRGRVGGKLRSKSRSASSRRRSLVKRRCSAGKIRNPATGLCVKESGEVGRKILGRSPLKRVRTRQRTYKLKPCKSGWVRDATTKRCRKSRSGSPRSVRSSPCPAGKIRNPVTGMCVKKLGEVGRKIQNRSPLKRVRTRKRTYKLKPCKNGWARNASTKRCRKLA